MGIDLKIRTIDEADIETVLQDDVRFEGNMEFNGSALIKGTITGDIVAHASLFVGQRAQLKTNINARTMSVKGSVKGEFNIGERLELFSESYVSGKIITADIIIQSGSKIHGTIEAALPEGLEQ